ncbi:MAG: hypothetical protein ACEY3A_00305 [Wolbachia sp.]
MLNANNEISVKKEERKHSWSTVFAWLYLKTIGRILPKRWNRWAENILYYDEPTADNEVQTDAFKTVDESAQVDLKPEVAEKENQRKLKEENKKLKGELEGANRVLKAFIGLCDDQARQIANLQTGNNLLEEENGGLKSKLAELKKSYRELAEVVNKRGKEFLAKLKERSETIVRLEGELINLSAEFANETRKLSVEGEEKDAKINNLKWLVETLEQNKKAIQDKVDEQQKTISDQEKRMKEQDALFKLLTDKNEAVEKDNESLRMQIMELRGKVSGLGREKEALQSNVNTLTAQLQSVQESKQQLEEEKSNIEQQKQAELEQTICKNAELEIKVSELRKEKAQFEEQLEAMKEERKTHEENQHELESQLKNLESRLSTSINKKKNLENDVAELQKQAQTLEGNKEWELAGIDSTLKETFLSIIELLAQQLLLNHQEQSVKEKRLEKLTLSYSDQVHQIAGLQAENLSLEAKNGKLLSVIKRSIIEETEVKKMDEKVRQNQLNENQHVLGDLEYKLESLENQSTVAKMQQWKYISHQENMKSMAKSEADLSHEKKVSFVKKRKNNLYNKKFVQSYTNSLPEDALEKSIKTKAKSLGSSNVQKLAKNISNEFMLPKNTNSIPNSFMSHTNNTTHVLSLSNVRTGS